MKVKQRAAAMTVAILLGLFTLEKAPMHSFQEKNPEHYISYPMASVYSCWLLLYYFHIILLSELVWFHLNLFCIERGFPSRTEIGERAINSSTVHIMGAVGNKTLCDCLPLPPSPFDLIRGVSWSPANPSPPPSHLAPPHALPHSDSFQLPRHILRMASNLQVVSMTADFGQQQ
jgi:hypothetical protein